MISPISHSIRQISSRLPLRVVLTVPFILQLLTSTGLVGYLSYRNGQQAVSDLANQLMEQTGEQVNQHLSSYLTLPSQINRINLDAIETGLLDINNLQQAGHFFRKQLDTFNVSYIAYGLANGNFIGAGYADIDGDLVIDEVSNRTEGNNHTYATDRQGNRTRLLEASPYHFLEEDWYQSTVEKNKTTWSPVYASDGFLDLLWIANSSPIRDANGEILGVISIDFLLSDIDAFIQDIHLSEHSKIFIIERNGAMIADSDEDSPTIQIGSQTQQRNIFDSQDPLVQAVVSHLKSLFQSFNEIQGSHRLHFWHDGQRQFLLINSWQDPDGLDWLVLIVVPESDFVAQINRNTRNTILLSLATLLIATQVGIWTARWVTNPLSELRHAAKAIENGELQQTIKLNRQDELGELAQSFNHMAEQLNSSFNDLKTLNAALIESEQQLHHYSQTLEAQVQERTQELSNTLEQLQATQSGLIESEKLAALGQLIAGIAHEINTPLGAIQASISNIDHALKRSLSQIPKLFQILSTEHQAEFFRLLDMATQPSGLLSSREERQLRRKLTQMLEEREVKYASNLADTLSKMGISEGVDSLVVLLKHPDALSILDSAYSLSSIQSNSRNIQLAVERASKIVFALKSYARQEQSGQKVQTVITDGIDTVLTIYHSQIKQGVEVVKTYHPIPAILCYPDELIQVWSNLIINAVQAMNYRGRLEISVTHDDRFISVQISDSGTGIPAEILDKIFSPFFTTKPMGEGSGLGLHIVRQIIDKHGGNIEVLNSSEGATFIVNLPITVVSK